jgi:hypothetical protein
VIFGGRRASCERKERCGRDKGIGQVDLRHTRDAAAAYGGRGIDADLAELGQQAIDALFVGRPTGEKLRSSMVWSSPRGTRVISRVCRAYASAIP